MSCIYDAGYAYYCRFVSYWLQPFLAANFYLSRHCLCNEVHLLRTNAQICYVHYGHE